MRSNNYSGVILYVDNSFDVLEFKNLTEQLRGIEAKQAGELRIMMRIEYDNEVEIKLPGRYPIDIPSRRALKALRGVEAISELQ